MVWDLTYSLLQTSNTNQTIAAAVKSMQVKDVGEIVIKFPEIPM